MRKILSIIAIIIFTSSLSADEIDLKTGNDFLNTCKVINSGAPSTKTTVVEGLQLMACTFYIQGFFGGVTYRQDPPLFCIPDIPAGQMGRVVMKWLADHPKLLHEEIRSLLYLSLLDNYLCNPIKPQSLRRLLE